MLIDSEIIAIRVESVILEEHGFPISAEEIADRYCGLTAKRMREFIEAEHGRALPSDFEERAQRETLARFERELEAIPGIASALASLDGPRCVASSSDISRIDLSLRITGLRDAFAPNIYSAQMVERGKPAPDLFLHAASEMGTEPTRCLVIEDSRHGVEAARSAGMAVVGFTGGQHCGANQASRLREAGATEVFDDMASLPALVRALGGAG